MIKKIPASVSEVLRALEKAGHKAFIVGGCVRDMLMNKTPNDWDVTTDARPEEVQKIFPDSFCENDFGTVGVKTGDEKFPVVEVTTFRTESGYSDRRRPDEVRFVKNIKEDLSRRDFTVNAIAVRTDFSAGGKLEIIDPFGGQKDIRAGLIRAVGDPEERFSEDALRLMRAIRFGAQLGFAIEPETFAAIRSCADALGDIARERIRDEFSKIILSDRSAEGVRLLQKTGLLRHIAPELEEGIGCTQNLHHVYTVWEHNLKALENCPSRKLSVRLAALFHDVGKPRTKRGEGKYATFYNHDHVGARMTRKILNRLRYPKKIVEHTVLLVDQHLFYYNVDEVTEAAVRRIVKRVGKENIKDLIDVRIADRLGSGVPKAKPYRLRHFEYMVEKVSNDPISVKMLKLNGDIMIREMGFKPGPKIGAILETLLAEVIEDPSKNNLEYLRSRAEELAEEDVEVLRSQAKKRIEEERKKEEEEMKKKYWVK